MATQATLDASFTGELIRPGEERYDEARSLFNGAIDRRPALIARCANTADVQAALAYARAEGLQVAVRGGGHSTAGHSCVDDGVVIDVGPIKHAEIDVEARTGRFGAGMNWGELDAATQEHGLAVPGGRVTHTGVAGLTLGSGSGWLDRKHGATCESLIGAEVVTASGEVVRASETTGENEELLWGLRGGGGNFGVVTEFEFDLVEAGPMVHVALVFWGLDQGREVLRLAREVMATLPLDLNIIIAGMNSPPAPFVPEEHHGRPGYAFVVVGFGSGEAHAALLDGIRSQLPPVWEFASPMPYVALQQMLDEANAWGFHNYEKGTYLEELTDEAIEVIVEHLPRKASPLSLVLLYRLDGAYSEVPDDATAFSGGRSPRYSVFNIAVCPVPELLTADRAWVRALWEDLHPHAPRFGTYVNSITEVAEDRVRSAFGPEKYERLAAIKATYDPGNVFRRNPNITPARPGEVVAAP